MSHVRTLLVTTALLVAACSGKSDGSGSSSAASTGTAAGTQAAPKPTGKPDPAKPAPAPTSAKPAAKGPMFKGGAMGMTQELPLVDVSLEPAGLKGLVIVGPEGTKVEKASLGGGAEVSNSSVNYSLSVREGAMDPAKAKGDFKSLDPDGKLVVDEPNVLLYERKDGSHVFRVGVEVGGKKYTCSFVATPFKLDRAVADQTVQSCKSIKKG